MSSGSDVSEVGDGTGWAALSFPLSDIFVHEIAPKCFTVRDFLSLGAVSRRYRDLLGPKTARGNRILGRLILDSAKHYADDGDLLFTEQLPTIGHSSVEESLAQNAILIAQLMRPASRRRSLITLPANVEGRSEQYRAQRQEVISRHRPKSFADFRTVVEKYRQTLVLFKPSSRFVGINLSGVNIYVHYIDQDGHVLVRDGDCVPPHQDQNQNQPESCNGTILPPHVFHHASYLYHSFAICYDEGGPPFAIYQQRRGYLPSRNQGGHAHAVAILPGARVQELNCDIIGNAGGNVFVTFRCRRTGNILPGSRAENSMRRGDDGNHDNTASADEGNGNSNAQNAGDNAQDTNSSVETLAAKEYYGFDLPSVDNLGNHPREWWDREWLIRWIQSFDPPPLRVVNPLGEAMYQEWIDTSPVATGMPVDRMRT